MKTRTILLALFSVLTLNACQSPKPSDVDSSTAEPVLSDPLPSWNEGAAKSSILDFVAATTTVGSPDFVAPADRIATFDNDGCLWSEQPFYFQLQFSLDRVKEMANQHPEWNSDPLFSAAIAGDVKKVLSFGEHGLLKLIMASHSGMTAEEFDADVIEWINTARHPKTNLLYKEMVYQPMLEVFDYLRANGFKTFIVSGGGIDFMRPWSQEVYGIPSEQVIGSSIKSKFELIDGKGTIIKLPELNFIDDKEGKPVGIHQHIGKPPIAAFGNSDGDLQMLQYSAGTEGKSLQVYVHHTDADREWAYDRGSPIGGFDKGWDYATENGWTIVDMKNDWKKIYPKD
ncbi:MAG: HAD family hydrolase [Algoriphagus sp.]|uniref:HAD family hydrolase n=1 Tax=Algoriphagus sp. TaxID=1872435 RepID=UPI0026213157|nr:HAD family hydrolase [Algoriphagus sp.]MDG1279284.1 HAD family hydrolase [Algoriphagus sp.]